MYMYSVLYLVVQVLEWLKSQEKEGYTIHRLLKYPCTDDGGKNGFTYHDEKPLDVDIVIVDEISMVDAYLFYYLLRAIPSGAKLICLGDMGQLESIGCGNIAFDMINSPRDSYGIS